MLRLLWASSEVQLHCQMTGNGDIVGDTGITADIVPEVTYVVPIDVTSEHTISADADTATEIPQSEYGSCVNLMRDPFTYYVNILFNQHYFWHIHI